MSSIAGVIVPNNFNIKSNSAAGPATDLFSGADTNIINVGAAANPVAGEVLTASVGGTAATWIAPEVTLTNAVALTNKNILTNTNSVAAQSLWCAAKTATVDVFASAAPTVGQILKATSSTTATWQTSDVNVVRGGFEGLGASGAATVLTTIELGNNPGSFIIEGMVTANINTGSNSAGWMVRAVFHQPIAGGDVVKDGETDSIVFAGGGALTAEGSPTWEIVPGSTQIKLVKTGTVSTVWGASWKYTRSGLV